MPRLFNSEQCKFQTFAVASMTSNATKTATMTGVTTADYCFVLMNTGLAATTEDTCQVAISAADTLMFSPMGAKGGASAVAQTAGVMVMKSPTSGQDGGSW